MKKLQKMIIASTIIVLFGSCKKEMIAAENNSIIKNNSEFIYRDNSKINYSNIRLIDKGFNGERESSTILMFTNMEAFKTTLVALENERNSLDSLFINFYQHLNEEEINAKEEEIGFDEQSPFYIFENTFGFYSLFHEIEDEMEVFLEQENPDWDNSPNNHFIADKVVRVLLNTDAEVIIGNSIYKFFEDGSYIEIQDQNMSMLNQINGRETSNLLDEEGIIIHGAENNSERSNDCKTNKSNRGEKKDANFKIEWKIQFYNYPWSAGMKSYVDSYKWHGGVIRKWKTHRTYLKVGVNGSFCQGNVGYNNGLSDPTGWVYSDRYNKKSWDYPITTTIYDSTKSGAVFGYHYGNGLTHNSTLTF